MRVIAFNLIAHRLTLIAELRLTTSNHAAPVNMWMHLVQMLPLKRLPNVEMQAILGCTSGETVTKKFDVTGGYTMEVCAVGSCYALQRLHAC